MGPIDVTRRNEAINSFQDIWTFLLSRGPVQAIYGQKGIDITQAQASDLYAQSTSCTSSSLCLMVF